MTSLTLEVHSKGENSLGLLELTELEATTLNQQNKPCKTYEYSDFMTCYKNWTSGLLKGHISCLIPGIEEYGAVLKSMVECSDQNEGGNTSKFFSSHILPNHEWKHECPLTCSQTSYNYNIQYLHKSRMLESESWIDSTFILSIVYSSLFVEERSEALVYDGVSFIAAAGGNLGLFLGFSFFSGVISIIKFIQKLNGKP